MATTTHRTAFWHRRSRQLCWTAAVPIICLFAPPSGASGQVPALTDPAAIDRAVVAFTGVAIGEVGGARAPTDPRLRLAACEAPLAIEWHGSNRSTLKVECPGPTAWRIFVATLPEPVATKQAPVVARGDPVTVLVRGRGFSVQQSGEAIEAGRVGDWIAIRTQRRADPIRARIERPGLAIIPAQ